MKGWRLVLFLLVGLCFSGLSLAQEEASNYWQDAKQVTDNKAVNPTPQANDPGEGGGSSGGGSGTCSNYTTSGTCPKLICEPSVGCQLPGGCGIGASCTVRYVPGTIYHYCHTSSAGTCVCESACNPN